MLPPGIRTSARFAPLRQSAHCDIHPLKQSVHRENKNCSFSATFLRLRTLFRPHKAKTCRHATDYLRFCASIRNWEARNNPQSQKSCRKVEIFVSGLSERFRDDNLVRAGSAQHRKQLRGGSRERQPILRSVAPWAGGAYRTAWRLPWAPPRPPQQKSGTQLGAALLVIFRSMPFL